MPPRPIRTKDFLTMAVAVGVFALGLTVYTLPRVFAGLETQGYSSTWGTLEESGTELARMRNRSTSSSHRPTVTYTYSVEGTTYQGSRYAVHPVDVPRDWRATDLLIHPSDPRACVVYFDAARPSQSVLVLTHVGDFGLYIGTTLLLWCASITPAVIWHRRRRAGLSCA